MPTYEYQCKTCGHHFEQFQRFSDDPLKECPKCSAEIRRVIYPTGVIFKGSGWYITDSRNASSSSLENGKPDKGTSESDSSASTEKVAAKSDE